MNKHWDQRKNNLDFLRIALAVSVIFSHSYALGLGSEVTEPVSILTRGQMTFGSIAVDLFFVMSGFLITASALRSKGLGGFFHKRVARIYPAFLVAALLGVSIFALAGNAQLLAWLWPRVGDFLLQTLRLREFDYTNAFAHNPFPNSINGSTWSIQYEFWCYVGVALLFVSGVLLRRTIVALLFVASLLLSVAFLHFGWIFGGKFLGVLIGSPQLWARLLPYYLAGVVFYLYRERIRSSLWLALASLAALVAATWIPNGWAAIFPIAGTYLVFYAAFAAWLPLSQAGRFGDFSYGTYLYAFPIQQILMQRIGHAMSPWLLFAYATPLTLIAAVLSWYGVERHFLQPARKKETIVHAVEVAAGS